MFSFFSKKSKAKRLDDRVYLTRIATDDGLLTDVQKISSEGQTVFLIYFFDETFFRLEKIKSGTAINFIKAEKIIRDAFTRNSLKAKISPVLLFAEHYPNLKTEDHVLLEIENIFSGTDSKPSIGFYTGLDEPLMKSFGSERITELMKQMGVNENEALSNSMITKSIQNAQEKITKSIISEIPAQSQEEWMKRNYAGKN